MKQNFGNNLIIDSHRPLGDALKKIKSNGKGCVIVLNKNKLFGTCSDGDIRNALLKNIKITEKVGKISNYNPKKIIDNKELKKKLPYFKKLKLKLVPLVDKENFLKDIVIIDELFKKKVIKKIQKNMVFITAGGKGSRLYPFTSVLPKPLMPIRGRTAIFKIINDFYSQGFRNFVITLNYKSSIIKNYLLDIKKFFKGIKLYFVVEKKPLGSLGSIINEEKKIKTSCIVTNCDTLTKFKYPKILKFHNEKKSLLTIVVLNKKFNLPYGIIKTSKDKKVIESINEKPEIQFLTNSGIYIINPILLKKIKKINSNFSIINLIEYCRKNNISINYFLIKNSQWHDIGTWINYEKTLKNY